MSEVELIARAKDGDREAFDDLVRLTYKDVYTLALRLTGSPDDAADVVQESYIRAFKGLRRFRGDAKFSTWMYRITANCSSSHLSGRNRHRHEPLDHELVVVDPAPDVDPELTAQARDTRNQIEAAVRSLPARLRAVVVLRDVYELSHNEIADELDISESAAKVRLHRARRKLAALLSTSGDSEKETAHAV